MPSVRERLSRWRAPRHAPVWKATVSASAPPSTTPRCNGNATDSFMRCKPPSFHASDDDSTTMTLPPSHMHERPLDISNQV